MCGNVFEWTGSLYRPYRYEAGDGRENPDDGEGRRVVRGGSWLNNRQCARCAYRLNGGPGHRSIYLGFRVLCVSPIP
jgi:formylglycine-generating enzyme required for sulfatase activity